MVVENKLEFFFFKIGLSLGLKATSLLLVKIRSGLAQNSLSRCGSMPNIFYAFQVSFGINPGCVVD